MFSILGLKFFYFATFPPNFNFAALARLVLPLFDKQGLVALVMV